HCMPLTPYGPAPARMVSAACSAGVSSALRAAAIPPWARAVFPAEIASRPNRPVVTRVTSAPAVTRRLTAVRPATPAPTTTIMAEPPTCAPVRPRHRLPRLGQPKFDSGSDRQRGPPIPRPDRPGGCGTLLSTDTLPDPGRR